MPPPVPSEEAGRLNALKRYSILDTPPERAFDRITVLAARMFPVPISLVTLVDESRLWFKAVYGLDIRETPRENSFSAHAIAGEHTLVVPDALEDARFRENPLVRGGPRVRFYAGAPLITPDGFRLGTLCVMDRNPRAGLSGDQVYALESLAATVMDELELRLAAMTASRKLAQTEERLHLTEEEWRGIIDASPLAIISLDKQGLIRSWSAAAEQMFGWTAAEMLGNCYPIIPEAEKSQYEDHRRRVFGGECLRDVETIRRRKDGKILDVSLSAGPLRAPDGEINGLVAVLVDIAGRKAAERALQESEERYRNLVENSPTAVGLYCEGRIVYANPAAVRLAGAQAAEELLGLDPAQFADPETLPRFQEARRVILAQGGQVPLGEVKMRRLNGSVIYAEVVAIRQAYHGLPAVQVVMRDVTDRKEAEGKAREQERDLATLANNLPAFVGTKNLESVYQIANEKFCEAFGCAPGQIRGKTDFDFFPPDLARKYRADDAKVMSSGKTLYIEETTRLTDGRALEVGTFKAPLLDESGAVRGLAAVVFDLTERRAMETALRQSEERFRSAILDAPIPAMIHTEDGRILQLNRAWMEQSGYTSEDLSTIADWIAKARPDAGPEAGEEIRGLYALESRTAGCEIPIRTKAGGIRTWSFSSAPLGVLPEGGRMVITMAIDITDRRNLEQQLAQAQKMEAIGQLAGGVAHDFNNLLTVIGGYSNLLLASLAEVGPARQQVREIATAAERASALTRQLLAFSRKQILQPTNVDVNAVVRESEHMLRRLIGEDIQIRVVLPDSRLRALVDPGQLVQVIMNLAVNARDAMPEGGILTIETAEAELSPEYALTHAEVTPGAYVELAISDTGTGMDQQTMSRIFDPFFTTKGVGAGTGLGLSTVYGIVNQSKGHISVSSEVGRGTKFRIFLPRVSGAERGPAAEKAAAPAQGTETILLVEDDAALRKLTHTILRSAGYKVIEAANGEEALRICKETTAAIPLMITDVVMPGMSGREAAKRLSALRPEMKVLYMSGYADRVVLASDVLEEGLEFIQKPFTPAGLAARVRAILDRGNDC